MDKKMAFSVVLLCQEVDDALMFCSPQAFSFFSLQRFTALMFVSSSAVVSGCNGGKKKKTE